MRPTVAALSLALLLVATACGSDTAEGETLDEFMGVGADGAPDEEAMAAARREQQQVEERVAECMAEQGFDYEPLDMSEQMGSVEEHPRQELDEDEFREEYGYGVSTWQPEPQQRSQSGPTDPNMERVQEMDDAERAAYEEALHGEPPDHRPDGEPVPFEPGGCRGEAWEAVRGDQQEAQAELGPAFQELNETIESDPRIVEAEEAWAECMRAAGWDVEERVDPQRRISEAHLELIEEARPSPEPRPGLEDVDPEELEELEEAPPMEAEIDEAALEELQERELDMAADDHECAQEHFPEELEQEVRAEHEGEFIEEHRETLEQLRDS